MITVQKQITLDLTTEYLPTRVTVKQYDADSRELIVTITNNGAAWTLDKTATPYLEVTRPDGEGDAFELSYSGDNVLCKIPAWATQVDGNGFADIAFVSSDGTTISTMPFELVVVESGANLEAMEQTEAYSLLASLIGSIDKIDEAVDAVISSGKELIGKYSVSFAESVSDAVRVTVSFDDKEPIDMSVCLGKTFSAKKVYFHGSVIIRILTASGLEYTFDALNGYTLVLGESITVMDAYH